MIARVGLVVLLALVAVGVALLAVNGGGKVAPSSRVVAPEPAIGGQNGGQAPASSRVAGGITPGEAAVTHPASTPAPGGRALAVTMSRLAFGPGTIRIRVGDAVRFSNRDNVTHNVTADTNPDSSGAGPFVSPNLPPGSSWAARFSAPGVYPYVCTIHPTMTGRVIVLRR